MNKPVYKEKIPLLTHNGISVGEKVRILDRHWLIPEFGCVTKITEDGQYKFVVQPEGMKSKFMFFDYEIEKIGSLA